MMQRFKLMKHDIIGNDRDFFITYFCLIEKCYQQSGKEFEKKNGINMKLIKRCV